MNTKSIWQSKTFWANLVGGFVAVAPVLGIDLGMDTETQATVVGGIMAVVNVVLRLMTNKPVGLKVSGRF
jgi:hypothetical protein